MLVHIAWTSTFLRRANNVIYFPEDRNEVRASVHARVWCVCVCVCASRWTRRPYNRWHYMKKFLKVLELFKDPPREGLWSKKYERSQLKTCKNATQRAILSGSSPLCVTLHSRARIYEMLGVFASRTTLRSWLEKQESAHDLWATFALLSRPRLAKPKTARSTLYPCPHGPRQRDPNKYHHRPVTAMRSHSPFTPILYFAKRGEKRCRMKTIFLKSPG